MESTVTVISRYKISNSNRSEDVEMKFKVRKIAAYRAHRGGEEGVRRFAAGLFFQHPK